jgi:hypothetical protein
VRDDRNLQHLGSVSCFLTVRERKAIGCILMNTNTRTLRLNKPRQSGRGVYGPKSRL